MKDILITVVLSYLLGAIPFGYILVRLFLRRDIRQVGSGNIGATNVARSSPVLGVLTLLLDALKGLTAVVIVARLFPDQKLLSVLAALCAVAGHIFSVWLKFRGGKGVATGLGSFVLLTPKAMLLMVLIFLLVVAVTRYVSLGSILAVTLLPVLAWALDGYRGQPQGLAMMTTASLLILAKHAPNFRRLLAGTESRFALRRAEERSIR